MTRAAYGPGWDLEANRRRLELTRGVTAASLAAQTSRDWTWLVAIDRNDPLREEREAVFTSAGVEVGFLEIATESSDRAAAAVEAYRAPWHRVIGRRTVKVAMTRLDDDDALAPWALDRIAAVARLTHRRAALILPYGVRVWNGHCTMVRHDSNAMQTLVTPPGDDLHVYGYLHRQVRRVTRPRSIDTRPAWVWTRHPDTLSGWQTAESPTTPEVRAMFPIDWSLLEERHPPFAAAGPLGRYFR